MGFDDDNKINMDEYGQPLHTKFAPDKRPDIHDKYRVVVQPTEPKYKTVTEDGRPIVKPAKDTQ